MFKPGDTAWWTARSLPVEIKEGPFKDVKKVMPDGQWTTYNGKYQYIIKCKTGEVRMVGDSVLRRNSI